MTDKSTNTTRRDFLKRIGLIAGTSAFIGSLPWMASLKGDDENRYKGPNDKIRVGLIGIGSRGNLLLLYLQKIPSVEITALCDDYLPNLEKAKQIVGKSVRTFTDYHQLIDMKNIDAVVIATPLFLHAKMTVDALLAGKDVFCEKSMAMTVDECLQMMNAQKKSGKILMIGHQRMFSLKYLKAYELIHGGHIGQIKQIRAFWHRNNSWRRETPTPALERKINWRLYNQYSRGLITELGSHQLQVANWFLGQTPEYVMGSGSINFWKDGREVDDNINLIYAYPNGVSMIYDSMLSNKHYGFEEQFLGNKGTIEPEANKYFFEDAPPAPAILQLINSLEKETFEAIPIGGATWVPDDPVDEKGNIILDKYPLTDGTNLQLEAFIGFVRKGKPIPEITKQGLTASVAALIGYEAMKKKEKVFWPDELKNINAL